MQLSSIVALLASGLAVAAQDLGTTTSTSTMTMTLTLTRCAPSVTACPAASSTSSTLTPTTSSTTSILYPVSNTTSSAAPTLYVNSTSTIARPTSSSTITQTLVSTQTTQPTTVVTAGASGVFAQSGLMLGLLAAGVAVLA